MSKNEFIFEKVAKKVFSRACETGIKMDSILSKEMVFWLKSGYTNEQIKMGLEEYAFNADYGKIGENLEAIYEWIVSDCRDLVDMYWKNEEKNWRHEHITKNLKCYKTRKVLDGITRRKLTGK